MTTTRLRTREEIATEPRLREITSGQAPARRCWEHRRAAKQQSKYHEQAGEPYSPARTAGRGLTLTPLLAVFDLAETTETHRLRQTRQ